MSMWDSEILGDEGNVDFLDDLAELDSEDLVEAIQDACLLAADPDSASEEEILNGRAAATIVAIWEGAPFSASDIIATYPFIRSAGVELDDKLTEAAVKVLEAIDTEETESDVDQFLEALV
ncbi:DUF4259 domain-containing protein [Corynebacterium aquatimens]|uniref:DUF4259 domain-containing protein n=1 Tax=Corynebacterium aquatimens TaxID=1190508 RepID=A0A931E669_9CORY|nr:DUF4259 domain-containing protein [Corynebacterium aquatimens]MBG6123153.1 hypothetical protein [Corynebacterium aquatimens]